MPKTYAEIRDEQKALGLDHLSSRDFSILMNKHYGNNDYAAGLGQGPGKFIKWASYGADQALNPLAEASASVGNLLFGEKGAEAFRGLPRMTLEMLPFAKGGKLATAGAAALMGANTYEKTNDVGAAAIAGGFGLAFPAAGRVGSKIFQSRAGTRLAQSGAKVLVADGLKREVLSGAAGEAALKLSAARVAAGQAANALNLGVGWNAAQRGLNLLGQQAGMFGLNVASQAAQGAYANGVSGFFEAMRPEHLAVTALAQLPLAIGHAPKALFPSPEAAQVAAYAKTSTEYTPGVLRQAQPDPIHAYILKSYQESVKNAARFIPDTTNFTGSLPGAPAPEASKKPLAPEINTNFPKTGVMKGPDGDYQVYGSNEKLSDGVYQVGSIPWLKAKGDVQKVVFPTKNTALGFIKANKIDLHLYSVHQTEDQHVWAKLQAKRLPTPEEIAAQTGEKPTFYDDGRRPPVDPQMELDLSAAAEEVRKVKPPEAPTSPVLPENLTTEKPSSTIGQQFKAEAKVLGVVPFVRHHEGAPGVPRAAALRLDGATDLKWKGITLQGKDHAEALKVGLKLGVDEATLERGDFGFINENGHFITRNHVKIENPGKGLAEDFEFSKGPQTNIDIVKTAPIETKFKLIDHDNPLISLPATVSLSESGPRILAREVELRNDLPEAEAVEEAVTVQAQQAKETVAKKGVAESNKARARAAMSDRETWWKSIEKSLPEDVKAVYTEFTKETSKVKSTRYQQDLFAGVYKWYTGTSKHSKEVGGTPQLKGAAGLRDVLAKVLEMAKKPQRVKRAPLIGIGPQGEPILKEEGSGRTNRLTFESRNEAKLKVEKFKELDPNSNWTVTPQGNKFVVYQDFLDAPVMSGDQNINADKNAVMEAMAEPPQKVVTEPEISNRELARQLDEARTKVGQKSVTEYVNGLHETDSGLSELEDLGRLNSEDSTFYIGATEVGPAELGAARLEFALTTFNDGLSKTEFFNRLLKRTDLFESPGVAIDFMHAAALHIGAWSQKIKLLGTRHYGEASTTINLEGEKILLPELLGRVGLNEPEHMVVASRLVSLHDNQDLAWAQLTNPEQSGAAGVFSISRTGERMIWLSTQNSPESVMFTLSHELGHGMWDLYQQGKLDSQTSGRMKVFSEFVRDNTINDPNTNNLILKELLSQLPAKYRNNPQLKALVSKAEFDVEENMANVQGLLSLSLATTPKSGLHALMQHLPASVSNFIAVLGKYGRKFMGAVGSLMLNRERTKGLGKEAREQLEAYASTMKSLLKVDEANALAVRQAMQLQVASEPMRLGMTLASPEGIDSLLGHGMPEAVKDVAKFMSFDKLKDRFTKPFEKASSFWDKYLQLGTLLGQKDPQLRYSTSRAVAREAAYNKHEFDMLTEYNMTKKGVHWVVDPTSAISQVESNLRLTEARDRIVQAVNKGKFPTHIDAINAKDPVVMAELAKLSLPEQQLVRENLIKFEHVHGKHSEWIREQRYEKLQHVLTSQLMHQDSSLPFTTAQQQAAQYVQEVRTGKFATTGHSDLDTLITESAKTFEDFHANAMTNLGFVTETRYGQFRARVEFAGKQRAAFVSAHSQKEFDLLKSQYESGKFGPMTNWIDKTKSSNLEFRMNEQVEFLIERDTEHINTLADALIREGLSPDRAREIVDQYSFAKELRNEMALRELSGSDKKIARFEKRRFVPGREHMDTLQQQIMFIQNTARALTKSTYKADFDAALNAPELRAHPDRPLIKQMWENYSRADPKVVQQLNKAQYNMFMSFHFLNMLQDAAQPILGALPANLVNEGQTIIGAYGEVSKSMLQVLSNKGLTAFEKAMLAERKKENTGLGMYSEANSNDVLSLIEARRMQQGLEPRTIGSILSKTILAPFVWGRSLHKHFTDYGANVALLTGFRHYTKQGMSPENALANAKRLVSISMFNAGKAGRSIGIRSGEGVFGQTVAATMTGLQTYALGTIGTLKNFVQRAVGDIPGIKPHERVQAGKALATSVISIVAQTGLYGLPGVAAALFGLEKVFGIKARQAVANMFKDEADSDGDDIVQQIALHGALNAFTGYDVASKSAVTGVLGFNSFDGFSLDQLAGPTWQLVENALRGVSEISQGKPMQGAVDILMPNQLKRMVKQAQNDWEFRDSKQRLLDYSSTGDQVIYNLLGLKPKDVARRSELINMQYAASEIDAANNEDWVVNMASRLAQGDATGVQTEIYKRVEADKTLSPQALGDIITKRTLEMETPLDPRLMEGASEKLNQIMQVPYKGPSPYDKFLEQQRLLQLLDFKGSSFRTRQQKLKLSNLQEQNPAMTNQEALRYLQQQNPRSLPAIRSRSWISSHS